MNAMIDWHSVITSLPSCVLSLVGGWYFGARYSEMSNRRRDYNAVALRVRNAISPALRDGYVGKIEPIDWDHLLHLLGRKRAAACQKARTDYQKTAREETVTGSYGDRGYRDATRVAAAAQHWFDQVPLR